MFGYYDKKIAGDNITYKLCLKTHLWGYVESDEGHIIYDFIKFKYQFKINDKDNNIFKWHISFPDDLPRILENGYLDIDIKNEPVIIIDIKPNVNSEEVLLVELKDIWGWTNKYWTNILYNCRIAVGDIPKEEYDKKHNIKSYVEGGKLIKENFKTDIITYDKNEFILSFNSVNARIKNREIIGTGKQPWMGPAKSSANSVLLWPEPLGYFYSCINEANIKYKLF